MDLRKSVHVHSKRKRLADPDGVSVKAVLDGLRKAGIFVDDSAKYIKEVSYSQAKCEKAEDEETVIVVTTAMID